MTGKWKGKIAGDPEPIVYYSGKLGADSSEAPLFLRVPYRFKCFSFSELGGFSNSQAAELDFCISKKVRVFIDSGAHTLQNLAYGKNQHISSQEATAYVLKYARFLQSCTKVHSFLDFCVTVDYLHSCGIIWDVTKQLQSYGIYPIPVFHGDDTLEWLHKYILEGHRLIGVSWSKLLQSKRRRRAYYDAVFNLCAKHSVALHGFAQTGSTMFELPWHSVDSSTWIKAAGYGRIIDFLWLPNSSTPRVRQICVSQRTTSSIVSSDCGLSVSVRELEKKVAGFGYSLPDLAASRFMRACYNMLMFETALQHKRSSNAAVWNPLL